MVNCLSNTFCLLTCSFHPLCSLWHCFCLLGCSFAYMYQFCTAYRVYCWTSQFAQEIDSSVTLPVMVMDSWMASHLGLACGSLLGSRKGVVLKFSKRGTDNNLHDNFTALKNELTKVTETNKQLQNEMSILREQLKKRII